MGGCDGGKIARLPIVNGIVGGAEASQRPGRGRENKTVGYLLLRSPWWGAKTRKAPLCKNNDNLLRVAQCATSTFCRKLESGFRGIGERETPLSLSTTFSFLFLLPFSLYLSSFSPSLKCVTFRRETLEYGICRESQKSEHTH